LLIRAPEFLAVSGVTPARKPAGGLHLISTTPAQTAEFLMRIRFQLFVLAAAFAACLAFPAEAAKKHKPRTVTAYSDSRSCAGATWGTAGRGPICNGPDYIGQDPDINIRAYLLKDLGSRYGGAY
jgi:hypothetical protein